MSKNKNKLGLPSIVLLGINSVIGSGIFLLPGNAYKILGTNVLFVYVFLSVVVMALAMCFAEAGSMFDRTGGAYVYVREAFGELPGFEVGFMRWCISIIAWATMAVGFSTALTTLWPGAASLQNPIAAGIVIILSLLNLRGVNIAKYMNNVSTVAKMVPLVVVAVLGIFFIRSGNFAMPQGIETNVSSFVQATLLIFYAFTGFETIGIAAGDMENPQKNLPKAIMIAMTLICAIYFLIQLVCIGILGTDLSESAAPFADAASVMFGNVGNLIVAVGTLISIAGINIGSSFVSPRTAVALADDNLFPAFMAKNNKNGVAAGAIICTAIPTILLALSGTFTQLAVISTVARLLGQYIPTCLAVLKLRTRKDLTATYRMPFGPLLPVISLLACLFLLANVTLEQILWGVVAALIGLVAYAGIRFYGKKHTTAKGGEKS